MEETKSNKTALFTNPPFFFFFFFLSSRNCVLAFPWWLHIRTLYAHDSVAFRTNCIRVIRMVTATTVYITKYIKSGRRRRGIINNIRQKQRGIEKGDDFGFQKGVSVVVWQQIRLVHGFHAFVQISQTTHQPNLVFEQPTHNSKLKGK